MRVAILIVATNKYIRFVAPLIESAEKYLLPGEEKHYFIFSDNGPAEYDKLYPYLPKISFCKIDHYPFPFPTLYRFFFFQKYHKDLWNCDQLIYIDADALFVAPVGHEVIGPRIAVQHCGFVGERGSYEKNSKSMFFVPDGQGKHYFGGGFWSFSQNEFIKLLRWATKNLETDMSNRIIPVWHDESMLNKYLIENPPTHILTPSYHYPEPPNEPFLEKWKRKNVMFEPKIMMLNKDHEKIRK